MQYDHLREQSVNYKISKEIKGNRPSPKEIKELIP